MVIKRILPILLCSVLLGCNWQKPVLGIQDPEILGALDEIEQRGFKEYADYGRSLYYQGRIRVIHIQRLESWYMAGMWPFEQRVKEDSSDDIIFLLEYELRGGDILVKSWSPITLLVELWGMKTNHRNLIGFPYFKEWYDAE